MSVYDEYRAKLRSPEQAAQIVKNGDWVDYTSNFRFPSLLMQRWPSAQTNCSM